MHFTWRHWAWSRLGFCTGQSIDGVSTGIPPPEDSWMAPLPLLIFLFRNTNTHRIFLVLLHPPTRAGRSRCSLFSFFSPFFFLFFFMNCRARLRERESELVINERTLEWAQGGHFARIQTRAWTRLLGWSVSMLSFIVHIVDACSMAAPANCFLHGQARERFSGSVSLVGISDTRTCLSFSALVGF